jgi:biopolymer transport protein ExbD
MRRYSQRQTLSSLSEINITPLLDLAFVLLIIFMITTPLFENTANLVIPTSGAKSPPLDTSRIQMISIDRAENMKLNQETIGPDALALRLTELRQANPDVAIVIRPDRELPVQKLVALMDVLQRAGITRVGIATKTETP